MEHTGEIVEVDMRKWQPLDDWITGLDVSIEDDANKVYLVTVTNSNGVFDYKINCEFPGALRNLSDDEKLQIFKDALNKYINKCRNERRNI